MEDDSNVIYERPTGSYSYADVNAIHEYEVIVDSEQLYKLTIYDTAGDGFDGTLAVYEDSVIDDSALLVKEPGFSQVSGTEVIHGFYAGSSPTQFLTLKFTFDHFAHEVAYELKNDETSVIFALAWFKTFDSSEEKVATMTIPIYGSERGDQSYTLKIWDDGNDGICCSWGDGGYQLYLGSPTLNNEENLLRSSRGDYGAGEMVRFVIEGDDPPTMEPTDRPTVKPTPSPTKSPSKHPTMEPSKEPSVSPTYFPTTAEPTANPSLGPSPSPTFSPLKLPFNLDAIFPSWSDASDSRDVDDTTPLPTPSPTASPNDIPYSSSNIVVERPAESMETLLLDDEITLGPTTYGPTNGATSNVVESIIAAAASEEDTSSSAMGSMCCICQAVVAVASISGLMLLSF